MPENDHENGVAQDQAAIADNVSPGNSALEVVPIRLPVGLWAVFVIGGVLLLALLLVSIFHPSMAERTKFFTVNALSLLVLVAIVTQAIIYRRQWAVMEKQGRSVREQLAIMDETLAEYRKVSVIAEYQYKVAAIAAEFTERNAKAAEKNVEFAKEAFEAGECAYFGVRALGIADIIAGRKPRVTVTLMNGGKTPAWHVRTDIGLAFGRAKPGNEVWPIQARPTFYESFYHAGEGKTVAFNSTQLVFTAEQIKAVKEDGSLRMFIFGSVHYRDFRNKPQIWSFCAVYDPDSGNCYDYEV